MLRETSQQSQAAVVNCCREPTSTKAVGESGREEEGSWEFSVGQSAGLRAATVSVAHTRQRVSSGHTGHGK